MCISVFIIRWRRAWGLELFGWARQVARWPINISIVSISVKAISIHSHQSIKILHQLWDSASPPKCHGQCPSDTISYHSVRNIWFSLLATACWCDSWGQLCVNQHRLSRTLFQQNLNTWFLRWLINIWCFQTKYSLLDERDIGLVHRFNKKSPTMLFKILNNFPLPGSHLKQGQKLTEMGAVRGEKKNQDRSHSSCLCQGSLRSATSMRRDEPVDNMFTIFSGIESDNHLLLTVTVKIWMLTLMMLMLPLKIKMLTVMTKVYISGSDTVVE